MGIIQITGRTNYSTYGKILGLDLINVPDLARLPKNAVNIACTFWNRNNLSALADKGDMRRITKRINGGYNGLTDRLDRYDRCLKVLT